MIPTKARGEPVVTSGQDWRPHMSFILMGSQILALQMKVGSNSRRQSKNIEMNYKIHIKVVHELYGTCFQDNVMSSFSI